MDLKIGGKYKCKRKIGAGAFGDIYLGVTTFGEKKKQVAIKIQPHYYKTENLPSLLAHEYNVYRSLGNLEGIANTHYFKSEKHKCVKYNVMVLDILGPSVSDLYSFCNRGFSLQTVCQIAIQILTRLEAIHSRGIIHRDIKPDNFLIGVKEQVNVLYLIDFGLAKEFMINGHHLPEEQKKGVGSMTGTSRYGSLNAHRKISLSRRDDLESLAYVLIHWATPKGLPWASLERHDEVYRFKLGTSIKKLCAGGPVELQEYLKLVRQLEYEEQPNYEKFRNLFIRWLRAHGGPREFDWTRKMQKQKQAAGRKRRREEL